MSRVGNNFEGSSSAATRLRDENTLLCIIPSYAGSRFSELDTLTPRVGEVVSPRVGLEAYSSMKRNHRQRIHVEEVKSVEESTPQSHEGRLEGVVF